jgi:hypothetical protein
MKLNITKLVVNNRWKKPFYDRKSSWTYFGLSKSYFSGTEFEYVLHFFGLDVRLFCSIYKNKVC